MSTDSPSTTDRLAEAAPLPDEELALMERLWAGHQTYVRQLLDEVYRLRARLDTAEGRLAAARDLHAKGICTVHSENLMWDEEGCVHCRIEWPCPTAEALGDNGSGVSR